MITITDPTQLNTRKIKRAIIDNQDEYREQIPILDQAISALHESFRTSKFATSRSDSIFHILCMAMSKPTIAQTLDAMWLPSWQDTKVKESMIVSFADTIYAIKYRQYDDMTWEGIKHHYKFIIRNAIYDALFCRIVPNYTAEQWSNLFNDPTMLNIVPLDRIKQFAGKYNYFMIQGLLPVVSMQQGKYHLCTWKPAEDESC